MARLSFCMTSILLLSLLILASASDYEYDKKSQEKEKPLTSKPYYKEHITKPEDKEKLLYHYDQSSKPEGKEKLVDLHTKLVYEKPKPKENEKPLYKKPDADRYEKSLYKKTNYEQPKLEEKEKLIPSKVDYEKPKYEGKEKLPINYNPEYKQPKPEDKENYFPTKPNHENYEQPKSSKGDEKILYNKPSYEKLPKVPEEKEKLIPSEVDYKKPKSGQKEKLPITYSEYKQPKQDQEKEKFVPTKPVYEQRPKYSEEKEKLVPIKPNYGEKKYEVPSTISVQGIVYCKTGLKYLPLPGAVAKVTCLAVDEENYKTTQFSVLSKPCDSKGYFYATISSPQYQWKVKYCKAFLNYSPLETCKVPTNVNNGISGDLLASNYKILSHHNNMKLFSAGPFFYTSDDHKPSSYKPVPKPNGY